MSTTTTTTTTSSTTNNRQIPIVCPGHTRPLAELQFRSVVEPEPLSVTASSSTNSPPGRTNNTNTTNNKTSSNNNNNNTNATTTTVLLVSACHDKMPMLRDGRTGNWIGTFVGHKGAVWSCKLDSTCNLAATASGDFSVRIWDAITGKSLHTYQHNHIVKTCDFSLNSRFLATGGHEGLIRIFNLMNFHQNPTILKIILDHSNASTMSDKPITTASSPPTVIGITKINWLDNSTILVGCTDGKIRVYDVTTSLPPTATATTTATDAATTLTIPPTHILTTSSDASTATPSEIRDMEVSFTNKILSVAAGSSVYFFDLKKDPTSSTCSYALLKTYQMPMIHFREEGGVSLHPNGGAKFIVGGSDLWVRVHDYHTGAELECLKGHHGPIRCLRYSPDGSIYATGSEDGTIRLWTT